MLKENLIINVLQLDFFWENPLQNFKKVEAILFLEQVKSDIILLPEMFSTGFTMNVSLAETMNGSTVQWMKQISSASGSAVAGSVLISDNGKYFNRFIWSTPEGQITYYDKRHLFRMGDEHSNFQPGMERTIISYLGWKICPTICYDLRFPVWSRNIDNAYDILINVANWPSVRRDVFTTLLKARAIENQCYVVGLNRVGIDGAKLNYSGDSMVLDPKGKCLLGPLPEEERSESISLDYKELVNFRNKFPVWKDADKFNLLMD
jgi:predicted amidohydrolase